MPDIIIVGAGAAGLMAAGLAAEQGNKVVVLEKMDQVGRKLSITGKGRCNLTHHCEVAEFVEQIQPDGRFLYSSLSNFGPDDLLGLLHRIGIQSKLERGGRYFPANNSAPEVTRRLHEWCIKNGVQFVMNFKVTKLLIGRDGIRGVQGIQRMKGMGFGKEQVVESMSCKQVLLCTGGLSYPATGSDGDGHRMLREVGVTVGACIPSLVPLEIDQQLSTLLRGLELRNIEAQILEFGKTIATEFGELHFIDTGLSGPIVLTLSRTVVALLQEGKALKIKIDFKPGLSTEKLDARLLRDLDDRGGEPLSSILRGLMPKKLITVCLQETRLAADTLGAQISAKERKRLHQFLKGYVIRIKGHRPFTEAIITKGGVSTSEINQKSMESMSIKGLYVAGELLDLDGPTGGYNLQIAFSTAYAAARSWS